MDERKVTLSQLEPGEYFDDSLPGEEPSRERVYRVIGIRTKTVVAENVVGIRRSFNRTHETMRTTADVYERLAKVAVPATPFTKHGKRTEAGGEAEVA